MVDEVRKKESSSSTCSKNFLNAPSSQSRCEPKEKGLAEDNEVQQSKEGGALIENVPEISKYNQRGLDIETLAESLGVVDLSVAKPEVAKNKQVSNQQKK